MFLNTAILEKYVEQVVADWPGAEERMAGMREYFTGLTAASE